MLFPPPLPPQSWRVAILLALVLPFTFLMFYWCHTTNSLGKPASCLPSPVNLHPPLIPLNIALTSFAYLSLFDIGRYATLSFGPSCRLVVTMTGQLLFVVC